MLEKCFKPHLCHGSNEDKGNHKADNRNIRD